MSRRNHIYSKNNLGLLLWGDVGTGKTSTAACIVNALPETGVPVLIASFSKILNQHIGYAPELIQTDNGGEFTNTRKTNRIHAFDKFCTQQHIVHKLNRPRTPWHNGKVERSRRSDQERFYNFLRFYSYEDLVKQMQQYLYPPTAFRCQY